MEEMVTFSNECIFADELLLQRLQSRNLDDLTNQHIHHCSVRQQNKYKTAVMGKNSIHLLTSWSPDAQQFNRIASGPKW